MKYLLLIILFGNVLTSCNSSQQKEERTLEEINSGSRISEIIRNPASASGLKDTVNVAKMEFDASQFDFGEVEEGQVVTHIFKFTNTGKIPLLINNARSTCGCTVPIWPKNPIAPGKGGEIEVKFNTKNKVKNQMKPITIQANTYPASTRVFLRGYVHPANGTPMTE